MAAAVNVWRPRPTCLSATVAGRWSAAVEPRLAALHLVLIMDSQSISMDMVGRDDLEKLAPFITNGDVEAAARCDACGELWLAQRDEAIWFSGDHYAHKNCD
jgi:hypothetical protein